jgi:acyl-CoA synthetase (AMP-forming)/AMP-acid ligase II
MDELTGASAPVHRASLLGVWGLLEQRIDEQPEAPAIVCRSGILRFRDLGRDARAWAAQLAAAGVRAGDRVALLSENRREYLVLLFACAKVGAVLACLNWRLSRGELEHCCNLVRPRLVVTSARFRSQVPVHEWPLQVLEDGIRESAAPADPSSAPPAAAAGEQGLYILYTSGTTWFPNAAVISHRAAIARAISFTVERPIPLRAAYVAWSPLFHMGAMDASLATLLRGAKVLLMDGFDSDRLADIVATEEIGHLNIVPGVVERFIDAMKRAGTQPRAVAMVGVMADLVPPTLIAELTRLLKAPYCNTFGSTETGIAPASRSLLAPGVVPQRLSKVQNLLCEVRLVGDDGNDVPAGRAGELLMRGPTLFSGYWGDDAATREAFHEGWYRMGDLFVRNPDGTLDFVDRRKYLIKSGGENIYPAEVERALMALPGVLEAVVVKAADPRWGEVPVAFVVPVGQAPDPQAVIDGCRATIASYKLPRRVVFAAFETLPRNASGKVERSRLESHLARLPAGAAWLPSGGTE